MRAIEHGRYLARAANTGISGVVDPYGRVVARSAIFEQVGLVEEVRFLTGRTVYTAIGDVVAYAAMAWPSSRSLSVGVEPVPTRKRVSASRRTWRSHWPSTSTTSNDASTT